MENPKPEIACMKKLAPFGQANPKAKWRRLQQYTELVIRGFSEPPLHGKPKTRNCLNERGYIIWSRKPKPKSWKLQQPPTQKKENTLNFCNARNYYKEKPEMKTSCCSSQQNRTRKKKQNSKREKQNYLQHQKQLCSQNGFSGLNILCCFAI
jgi:hypothetical protein